MEETRAVKDLKNVVTREDEARNQRAVDALLRLGAHASKPMPEHENPLVEHALRNAKI